MRHFGRETQTMIVCKLSTNVIIAFESEIVAMSSETYQIEPSFSWKWQTTIRDMKLSLDEKLLSMALVSSSD